MDSSYPKLEDLLLRLKAWFSLNVAKVRVKK